MQRKKKVGGAKYDRNLTRGGENLGGGKRWESAVKRGTERRKAVREIKTRILAVSKSLL